METKQLAVIIVSYNTADLLRACLDSLADSGTDASIVVVDNNSNDGSQTMVKEAHPAVRLIALTENLGFAAANNVALRALGFGRAEGGAGTVLPPEFVFFLNPDTEVRAGALDRLRRFLKDNPKVGVVGPSLVYADGSFQHSAFSFPTLWQIWFDFFAWPGRFIDSPLNGRYPRRAYEEGQPFAIDHPLGAALMTRREVVAQVGLMDEGYFMYAEEIDWCLRVRRQGWDIFCVPAATIVHHAGGSTRQQPQRMNQALWQSRFRLFRKHYSFPFRLAARGLFNAGRLVRGDSSSRR